MHSSWSQMFHAWSVFRKKPFRTPLSPVSNFYAHTDEEVPWRKCLNLSQFDGNPPPPRLVFLFHCFLWCWNSEKSPLVDSSSSLSWKLCFLENVNMFAVRYFHSDFFRNWRFDYLIHVFFKFDIPGCLFLWCWFLYFNACLSFATNVCIYSVIQAFQFYVLVMFSCFVTRVNISYPWNRVSDACKLSKNNRRWFLVPCHFHLLKL